MHHFFSNVIRGIIEEAEKNGYLVIILQSSESAAFEKKKQIELLIQKRVDGIIISLSNESNNETYLTQIISKEIPLVQFDKIAKLIPSSKVIINDQKLHIMPYRI